MFLFDLQTLAFFLVLFGTAILINRTDLSSRLEAIGNLTFSLCGAAALCRLMATLKALEDVQRLGVYLASSMLIVLYALLTNAALHVVAAMRHKRTTDKP